MAATPPLLLKRSEIASLLTLETCLPIVAAAFAAHARGETFAPALSHVEGAGGEFHLKSGGLRLRDRASFALKANGGFFQNPAKFGLPAIQGLLYLADAANGCPLAVMDSRDITRLRTGAATAIAARYLARPDSAVATLAGCGVQGRVQLQALLAVLPLRKIFVWSRSPEKAAAFAAETARTCGIPVVPSASLKAALAESDVLVTCTPAKKYFVESSWVRPGTFVAAVGADSPDKQELDPRLLANSVVIGDLLDQCIEVGDLHHAIGAGLMTRADARGELGQVIAGTLVGRRAAEEIVVFDSTGTALQDVATAAAVYEAALARGVGTPFSFAE